MLMRTLPDVNAVIPGDYTVDGVAYRAEATATGIVVRYVRWRTGTPAPDVLAHVRGTTVAVTGNGHPHAARLAVLEAAPGRYRTAVRCRRCGQIAKHLIDGLGRDCWEQLRGGVA
jgi:hypothetical protein